MNRSPVLHFWSLAVEEQFYLLWPLLLAGAVRLTRRLGRLPLAVTTALVATGIASLSYQLIEMPIRRAAPLDRFR